MGEDKKLSRLKDDTRIISVPAAEKE